MEGPDVDGGFDGAENDWGGERTGEGCDWTVVLVVVEVGYGVDGDDLLVAGNAGRGGNCQTDVPGGDGEVQRCADELGGGGTVGEVEAAGCGTGEEAREERREKEN